MVVGCGRSVMMTWVVVAVGSSWMFGCWCYCWRVCAVVTGTPAAAAGGGAGDDRPERD